MTRCASRSALTTRLAARLLSLCLMDVILTPNPLLKPQEVKMQPLLVFIISHSVIVFGVAFRDSYPSLVCPNSTHLTVMYMESPILLAGMKLLSEPFFYPLRTFSRWCSTLM